MADIVQFVILGVLALIVARVVRCLRYPTTYRYRMQYRVDGGIKTHMIDFTFLNSPVSWGSSSTCDEEVIQRYAKYYKMPPRDVTVHSSERSFCFWPRPAGLHLEDDD